jgi:hypothetical protein
MPTPSQPTIVWMRLSDRTRRSMLPRKYRKKNQNLVRCSSPCMYDVE